VRLGSEEGKYSALKLRSAKYQLLYQFTTMFHFHMGNNLHGNHSSTKMKTPALIFRKAFDVGDLVIIFYILVQFDVLFYSLTISLWGSIIITVGTWWGRNMVAQRETNAFVRLKDLYRTCNT